MTRIVKCVKLKKEAEGLDFPPIPGELGKKVWEHVSKEAWNEWVQHQTMLVNEYRLNLSDVKARKYLSEQLEAHFFGDGADQASGYVPKD
ncbi:MAG: oxidative damage protection protein [Betaproteobacteria bacterium TMED82]|nr:MAG: oxidative damage protection protein [Betaproteobacteria bacterium TMED82]|tara:strand:- start:2035 stop:2304 length:270 start_codon:yes stop_codon:yes gene_type:complete